MLETFRNAWKIQDLRKKIIYTLLILLIYRIGSVITVPGVNVEYIAAAVRDNSVLSMLNFMSGSLTGYTIFAMGIQPYITASIVMNLLTVAIPPLERLQKEGEEGRKKIAQYTRYVTVILGFIQAVGITMGLGADAVVSTSWFNYLTIGLSLAAGTAFVMWLGERINEKGVGNGISLIIFVGIISQFPGQILSAFEMLKANTNLIWWAPVIVVFIIAMIAGIVFVDEGVRRIPVQYAKRVVGRKMYGGQTTHIPMKVNSSGVMPLIFAMSMIQFPGLIAQFWPTSGFALWYRVWMSPTSPIYLVIFAVLIVFFAFFYSSISFNAIEIAKNVQQNGGFIPGIRPGKPTSDYLQKVSNRITVVGAVFLMIVATIPSIVMILAGSQSTIFTATGILITVSVALETSKQIESQMLMRHYKGFMR